MDAVLHAVARLIQPRPPDRSGLAADVAEALADAPRLSIATRLGLVALASRIEAGAAPEPARVAAGARPAPLEPLLAPLLAALSRDDEMLAIESLVDRAPALRAMAAALAVRRDPYALLPLALLELVGTRLH